MKSQAQLQQQAAAAALAKKSGNHGNGGNGRRLRRNVDVVVNALAQKNRSQSNNLTQQAISQKGLPPGMPQSHGTTNSQGPVSNLSHQPMQYPNLQGNHYSRKQMVHMGGSTGPNHSHSQQILDNSQAIQQKINMYNNQAHARKLGKNLEHSPIGLKGKTGSIGSTKIVPAQLSRAFLQQRANQTPTPSTQQMYQGPNQSSDIQSQLNQMMVNRRGPNERNNVQQNLMTNPANLGQNSSYYDSGLVPQHHGTGKINHHLSAQQFEQIPRANSQLSAHGPPKTGSFVQIKGMKGNRNTASVYGGTMTQRQKSSKQINQNNTLYSQISLKETQSPGKMIKMGSKVNISKTTGQQLYGTHRGNSQKYSHMLAQQVQGTNSVQAFGQYAHTQPGEGEAYLSNVKDMNQFMEGMSGSDSQNKSRNYTNVVTTNGVATHTGHGSQGAILNINTASDINIYNNAFIVQTSPQDVTKPQASGSSQVSRQVVASKRQGHKNGHSNNSGLSQASSSQRSRNPAGAPTVQHTTNMPHHGAPLSQIRSMSTGRNQKSSHSQRSGSRAGTQHKTNRAHAINEAYNSSRSYLINNQQILPPAQTNQQLQATANQLLQNQNQVTPNQIMSRRDGFPQQEASIQSRSHNNVYDQETTMKLKSGNQTKGYNSTENIKRSGQNSLASGNSHDQNTSSLNRPVFNNLVQDSQKRLFFAQESGMQGGSKRNFKNVKKNREAFNTQPTNELGANSKKFAGMPNNVQKQQQQTVRDRTIDLINRGRLKIKQKEYNDAIKLFSEVLEHIDPLNVDAIFYRALSYLDQGNLQQSISELWRVVENKPDAQQREIELSQQAYVLLSIAHKRLGEHLNAVQDLQICIERFPLYSDAYLARGQTLLLQENFGEALADYEKFIKLNKNPFNGFLGVGDCQKAMKNFSEATKAYTRAIQQLSMQNNSKVSQEHLYQQCYMKRGMSGYHEGKNSQSLTDLQCVIQKDTSNVKAHYYIGKLLAKGTENEHSKQTDAILHFEQVAKFPDQEFYYGNAMFQIAKLRLRQKDYYEAFHCLKRAADNNFTSKRLAMYKDFAEGVLYLVKRKIKKGVQILSDLLEILVNKDKDEANKEEGKNNTIDLKKRQANKAHVNYLIHQILLFRSYGYVAIEKYEVAQDDIRRVRRYGKIDAATTYNKWLGKGILRMDHEDYLMATKFFTKAWKKFPGNKDPYCLQVISVVRSYTFSMGGYHIDQQVKFSKVLETKKFMDKAIAHCCKNQQESSLYFFRGLLNFQMHNFYEALADFNSAIDAEEESSAHFFLARGRTYACLSILTEAMKDLSVALNLDETLQQAYIYRGKCAYLIGDNNLAFLDFQRLILTDPKNPMVHVYAGNLLMTTGAYQDAIKAYENADTVEPTTISSFQRVRCYCAISDLQNAKNLLDMTKRLQPDDVILNFDGLCLDELIKISQASNKMIQTGLTPGDVKNCDQVLTEAIRTFDELISTYESEKLAQLKRRDAILNVQIIPNVQRIRAEKLMVARDIQLQKEQLPKNQRSELPSLSVDLDEPINAESLEDSDKYSYYYENIFNLEDFYLYRGVFNFYKQRFQDALVDFDRALISYKQNRQDNNSNENKDLRNVSGFNSHNVSLQHYTMNKNGQVNGENTLVSCATDLSDVGLGSFNELEITFNILLCYMFLNDKSNCLAKLNDLQRKTPKKYTQMIPVLRMIVCEHFGDSEKTKAEITKLQKTDPNLYKAVFNNKASTSGLLVELFPGENRLCTHFAQTPIRLGSKKSGLLQNTNLQVRLSFSMPFIKPPNMIPNVDEGDIQSEFNLKQIDAPMPEAPWIKRCGHGINFTNHITKEGKDREKYKKFFENKLAKTGKQSSTNVSNTGMAKDGSPNLLDQTVLSTTSRILNNMNGETLSDRNKISLMEESSPRIVNDEETCKVKQCQENNHDNALVDNTNASQRSIEDQDDAFSDQVIQTMQSDSSGYDSEEMIEKGTSDGMVIRVSGTLIEQERDSMPNMGENLIKDNIKEIKKMKKEMVEPNLGINRNLHPKDFLPKLEESKSANKNASRARYAQQENIEQEELNQGVGLLSESQLQSSQRHSKLKLQASQQLVDATQNEPHGLNEKMLAGQAMAHKQRERRVSQLSLGDLSKKATIAVQAQKNKPLANEESKNDDSNNKQSLQGKRSLFRTSIDNEESP